MVGQRRLRAWSPDIRFVAGGRLVEGRVRGDLLAGGLVDAVGELVEFDAQNPVVERLSRIGKTGTWLPWRWHRLLTNQRMGVAMSSQRPAPKPPQPPRGAPISLDADGILRVNQWQAPARGATIQTIDGTGKRITVTRLFVTGLFAFALKKKTGALSVVVCRADGDSTTVKVSAKKAQDVMAWAVAFNAWSEVNS